MSGMSPVRNQCWDECGVWEENGNSCLNEQTNWVTLLVNLPPFGQTQISYSWSVNRLIHGAIWRYTSPILFPWSVFIPPD